MTGMTIGNIEIPSIQSINLSTSTNTSELNLLEKDDNFILSNQDAAPSIEIEFTITPRLIENSTTVSEKRKEILQLSENSKASNSVVYNNLSGFISIESVSIPENSDSNTIRTGTIEGNYLPWPKNLTGNSPY